jgi:hypothetical protein
MQIITRFSIGDVVFASTANRTDEVLTCPDCGGEREYEHTTPGGTVLTVQCPRCSDTHHGLAPLRKWMAKPEVQRLTIGQVRHETGTAHRDAETMYMCAETGVGTGRLYHEKDLHASEEEAWAAARSTAAVMQIKIDEEEEQRWRIKIAQLRIPYALSVTGMQHVSDAWWDYRHLRSDIEELFESDEFERLAERDVDNIEDTLSRALERSNRREEKKSTMRAGVLDRICVAYECARSVFGAIDDALHEESHEAMSEVGVQLRNAYGFLMCYPEEKWDTLDSEMVTRAQGVYDQRHAAVSRVDPSS